MLFQHPVPVNDCIKGNGTQGAPTAGTNVISISAANGAIPAGIYQIKGQYLISGATETAAANLRLKLNGATYLDFPTNGNPVLGTITVDRITLDGTNSIQLAAVANAVASTVYTAWLTAVRIG